MTQQIRDALAVIVADEIVRGSRDEIPYGEVVDRIAEDTDSSSSEVSGLLSDYATVREESWDEQYVTEMADAHPEVQAARSPLTEDDSLDSGEFSGDVTEISQSPGDVMTVNLSTQSIDDDKLHSEYECRECGGQLHEDGRDREFCTVCGAVHFNGLTVLEDVGHPLVPEVGNDYIRRRQRGNKTDVENVSWSIGDPDYATLLEGEAGVGKDFLIEYICAQTNRPMIRLDFGEGVLYEDLVGGFEPVGSNSAEESIAKAQSLSDEMDIELSQAISALDMESSFDFKPGFLHEAVENGYVFVADEVNAAGPEATMALHGVTENRASRHLSVRQTGEVLNPHDQFRFVATMNPSHYAGTKELNDAFKTRFWIEPIDYLNQEAEKVMVLKQTKLDPEEDARFVEDLVEALSALRSSYAQQDIITPIGHREAEKIGKLARRMDNKEAAKKVLMDMADPGDKNAISKVIDMFL